MSPAIVTEVIEGLSNKLKSPLLIFVLILNLGMLGFIYYGVSDRRQKDHELMQSLMKECVNLIDRR